MNKCREYAMEHNITVVGKLKRKKLHNRLMNPWMKLFIDEDGNEFWVFRMGGIEYVNKDKAVLYEH